MKIIYRTLVLLAAAALVSGATYTLVGAGALGGGPGRPQQAGAPRSFEGAPGQPIGERPEGPGRDRRGGARPFAIGELLRSLAIIGVIVLLVAPLTRLLPRKGI